MNIIKLVNISISSCGCLFCICVVSLLSKLISRIQCSINNSHDALCQISRLIHLCNCDFVLFAQGKALMGRAVWNPNPLCLKHCPPLLPLSFSLTTFLPRSNSAPAA